MSTELLPCPHCGEAYHLYPAYLKSRAGEDKPYAIDCLGCGADYTPRGDADVIALWNRRAQDPRVKQLEEALRPFAAVALELPDIVLNDDLVVIETFKIQVPASAFYTARALLGGSNDQ